MLLSGGGTRPEESARRLLQGLGEAWLNAALVEATRMEDFRCVRRQT